MGKFGLGQTIGEGTFSKFKLARNMETGEVVAIKILDKNEVLKHDTAVQVSFNHTSWIIAAFRLCPLPSHSKHPHPHTPPVSFTFFLSSIGKLFLILLKQKKEIKCTTPDLKETTASTPLKKKTNCLLLLNGPWALHNAELTVPGDEKNTLLNAD